MRTNGVRAAWADDRAALGAWLTIPSGFSAEIMAHAGFDWVCVDMQHGVIDYQQMVVMLQAISATDVDAARARAVERARHHRQVARRRRARRDHPDGEHAARKPSARCASCRYAPAGGRSYGPLRANYYVGFDYFEQRQRRRALHRDDRDARSRRPRRRDPLGARDRRRLHRARRPQHHARPAARARPRRAGLHRRDRAHRRVAAARTASCPGIAGNQITAPKRVEQGFRLVEVASDARLLGLGAGRGAAGGRARRHVDARSPPTSDAAPKAPIVSAVTPRPAAPRAARRLGPRGRRLRPRDRASCAERSPTREACS